ncbi:protein vestigial [Bacillus rossius redtenbacheri]|uniref:protein vestigial n=1 Tax=Bacillus rossius redtenbacheri TaxID=93214 RepID=UPI002FDC8FC3
MGSPGSPALRHKDEEPPTAGRTSAEGGAGVADDDDDDDGGSSAGSRAQYVSANCVVFTHYSGDVAAVVDEHFNRALSYSESKGSGEPNTHGKESSPMSARNFPPSFWNSSYQSTATVTSHHAGDIYPDPYHSSASAASDPWHSHYQQYSAAAAHHHHRAVHEYHHHNMAQYGGLLLPPATRLPPHVTAPHHQYSKGTVAHEAWGGAATHSAAHHPHHAHHAHHSHALDTAAYTAYPSMADFREVLKHQFKSRRKTCTGSSLYVYEYCQ